jgi:RimJ/RimL family protein N-acetyltransferase
MEPVEFHEAGLLLRPWRPADADAVYRACQDSEIQRWTSIPRPYLREHAESFVTTYTKQTWSAGTAAPLGVFDAATGEMLGSNGLIGLHLDYRAAEVGYWVAPWARRRGVATNATRAVARWCLDSLGVRRIAWRAELGNHASRLVAERLGFRMEGVQRNGAPRFDGGRVDCWGAALLPGELREPDAPVDLRVSLRAVTFGGPKPRLVGLTPAGAKLSLRAPEARDFDAIIAACHDPESVRWTSVPNPYGRDQAEFFVNRRAPGQWAGGEAAVFAVADANDAYAGSIELRIIAARPAELATATVADVGYLIAPWARGRGYASAALRVLCGWGFESLGLHRIEWRAHVGNDGSRRVAEKAGFTIEGVARAGCTHRGELRDAWFGSILATDARAA